jgi:hypothetical protein
MRARRRRRKEIRRRERKGRKGRRRREGTRLEVEGRQTTMTRTSPFVMT